MFGTRIISLRKSKDLTQTELAEKIGLSRSALSLYELEKREPDIDTVKKIATYFGVSIDYLLGNIDHPTPNAEKEHSFFFFFFNPTQVERLKCLIKNNGISIKSLASRIGVSDDEISKLLNGEEGNLEIILKIAKFFDVSMDYLLCRTDYAKVISPESEVADLLSCYDELNRIDQRWIMGQIIDLIKKKNNKPEHESVAADSPSHEKGTENSGKSLPSNGTEGGKKVG